MKGFKDIYESKNNKFKNKSKNQIIIKAVKLHQKGNINEAIEYYEYCIKKGFNSPDVFSNFGLILKDLGKLVEAENYISKAIQLNPNFADAYNNLGATLQSLHKLDEAELSLRKAIEIKPLFSSAYNNLGNVLKDSGKLKEAELSLRKAIEINPEFASAHNNLGSVLMDSGKLKEAELSFRKAIDLKPNYANAHNNLGNILKDLGELDNAEFSLRKAIEINPNFADAYNNLGTILKSLRKFNEAEKCLLKAAQLRPNKAVTYYNLGNFFKDVGKLSEAEMCLRKAIEIQPEFASAYNNLGNILKDIRKLGEAEKSFRKAIKLKPNYASAHNNLGDTLRNIGKLKEAEISVSKAIELNQDLVEGFLNLGLILEEKGKLNEAEKFLRKAIKIKPTYESAYVNLGNILKNKGKLKEAEISVRKAIELQPNCTKAYFALSVLRYENGSKTWQEQLFQDEIFNNILPLEKIDVYFARANVLHNRKDYKASAEYLKLANNLKLELEPSSVDLVLKKSKILQNHPLPKLMPKQKYSKYSENIFIVGMPRSGSTLAESIISMNKDVADLGESNIFEKSFIESEENKVLSLYEIYLQKIKELRRESKITTNKFLYNYQFSGIIASKIPNSKIIHCFRNPLDNILSIYRANFAKGNEYSSSLSDCAKVYLDQEEIMTKFKSIFSSKIYSLNYELLVRNPSKEIKSLIQWLGWDWEDKYLEPHLNKRLVFTASNVQVRSPINSKSVGGWKMYQQMLKPAIDVLIKNKKYEKIISDMDLIH